MPVWAQYGVALLAVVAAAPLIAWLGRTQGKKIKRGSALALMLIGFGQVIDPPARHAIEAQEKEEEGEEAAGDPPKV